MHACLFYTAHNHPYCTACTECTPVLKHYLYGSDTVFYCCTCLQTTPMLHPQSNALLKAGAARLFHPTTHVAEVSKYAVGSGVVVYSHGMLHAFAEQQQKAQNSTRQGSAGSACHGCMHATAVLQNWKMLGRHYSISDQAMLNHHPSACCLFAQQSATSPYRYHLAILGSDPTMETGRK